MKTIERYVFGAFLSSFFLAFLVLSFVLTIGLMVQIVGYMMQGVPIGLVGRFAAVSFPETMQWTIPLGLLVASILVFSRLSADSEVAAMRACGVNLLTVMRWPLVFGALMTALGLFINNEIVPRGHEVRRQLALELSVGTGLELLEPGHVNDDFPNVKILFERREGNWLYDVIAVDFSNPKFTREVTASKALVLTEERDIVLDLYDMTIDPVDDDRPGMARAARIQYRVKDALKEKKYNRKMKDFRFFELLDAVCAAREQARNASGSSRKKGSEKYLARRNASNLMTEFMKRFVFAFASVCFVFVGVPLGIRAQRKESTVGMAIALATALVYYLTVILATSMSKHFAAHPEVIIWLPVALCAALAARLIPKNL